MYLFFFRNPAHFDLIYYDGLGEQDKEIRLTIGNCILAHVSVYYNRHCLDTAHKTQGTSEEDDDLVPPLEHCIRTWLAIINACKC